MRFANDALIWIWIVGLVPLKLLASDPLKTYLQEKQQAAVELVSGQRSQFVEEYVEKLTTAYAADSSAFEEEFEKLDYDSAVEVVKSLMQKALELKRQTDQARAISGNIGRLIRDVANQTDLLQEPNDFSVGDTMSPVVDIEYHATPNILNVLGKIRAFSKTLRIEEIEYSPGRGFIGPSHWARVKDQDTGEELGWVWIGVEYEIQKMTDFEKHVSGFVK